MAGCRKILCETFEGVSNLELKSKCAKVHGIVVSLSPMKTAALNNFTNMCCPIDIHILAHESFFMLCECCALSLGCRGRAWAIWSE